VLIKNKKMKSNQPSQNILKSLPYGALGGAASGIIIFSFASLTGHSGTTGSEYVGAWDWGNVGLGILYGGFFGLLLGPLGYFIFLKNIELKKAILPAFIGTTLSGCAGALTNILKALLYGCIGFFLALAVLRVIYYFKNRSTALRQS
jgi:hypothetical protein